MTSCIQFKEENLQYIIGRYALIYVSVLRSKKSKLFASISHISAAPVRDALLHAKNGARKVLNIIYKAI